MSIGFFFIWMFVQIKKRTKKLCQEKPTVSLRAAFTFCMSLVCVTKLCMKCVAWTVNLIGPINTRRPPSPRRRKHLSRNVFTHGGIEKSCSIAHPASRLTSILVLQVKHLWADAKRIFKEFSILYIF